MFELCKYLDSKRLSNNHIDSSKLIRIYRMGNDDKVKVNLKQSELITYTELKDRCTKITWEKLDLILEEFNNNWNRRSEHQTQLEILLKKGLYKDADDYYIKHTGCLKYLTQYINLKTRFFSKCSFYSYIKDLDFIQAEKLFNKYCNDDMHNLYLKKIDEAVVNIQMTLSDSLDNNDFVKAKDFFDFYITYMECDSFSSYLESRRKQQLESISVSIAKDFATQHEYENIENYFQSRYPKIPYEYLKSKIIETQKNLIVDSIVKMAFNEFNSSISKFIDNLTVADKTEIFINSIMKILASPKNEMTVYNAYKVLVIYFKNYIPNLTDLAHLFIESLESTGLPTNKSQNAYKGIVVQFLSMSFEKENYDDAATAYNINNDILSRTEFDAIRSSEIKKKITIYKAKLPDTITQIRNLYKKNKDVLNPAVIIESENLFTLKLKEREVHSNIDNLINKLQMLSTAYVGIKEQNQIKKDLLNKLKGIYRSDQLHFNASYIDKVNTVKQSFDPSNHKSLFPNVKLERPNKIEDAVFFHKNKYYIASFLSHESSYSGYECYKIKPYKSAPEIVNSEEVIIIGTLIRDKSYHSHCYNCKQPIDGGIQLKCPKCNWYICSNCEACGCGYSYSSY